MHTFDFLVLGSGSAGLSYALTVADYGTVGIITKKNKADSNTNYAQGGIASVFDDGDSFDSHIKDTLAAGADLCNYEAVKTIVEDGPVVIKE
ncbi:MAG: FAD-binding protein [Balneolales bacterium]